MKVIITSTSPPTKLYHMLIIRLSVSFPNNTKYHQTNIIQTAHRTDYNSNYCTRLCPLDQYNQKSLHYLSNKNKNKQKTKNNNKQTNNNNNNKTKTKTNPANSKYKIICIKYYFIITVTSNNTKIDIVKTIGNSFTYL